MLSIRRGGAAMNRASTSASADADAALPSDTVVWHPLTMLKFDSLSVAWSESSLKESHTNVTPLLYAQKLVRSPEERVSRMPALKPPIWVPRQRRTLRAKSSSP